MKVLATAASLAALAVAAPTELETRQSCEYGFVFARGSTEPSPLGMLIGPSLERALKGQLPGLKTFPVLYAASLMTNINNDRTDGASIKKGVEAFQQAQGCKVIVAGGYSQGAAVMHNVVGKSLDASLKAKIAGVALFGDTRNQQDKGHIPNFPTEKSKVWCNASDGVCSGALLVNAGHLSYSGSQINEAAKYLGGLAKSHSSSSGSSSSSSSSSSGKGGKGKGSAPKASSPKGSAPKGGKGGKGGKGSETPAEPAPEPAAETPAEPAAETPAEPAAEEAGEAMSGHSHGGR